ncbi:tetratricopeptide repeat protein [Asticcacaulis sp. AC402]|uniref:tetratricopeptide repeat protein n=1 Tax=Asticcacaulis sp. AC402 TaxID=1282361 RepID=UPI0003C3E15E|nr:tetratricopeptide repeat protein [Asticcacaulis sp. AC402]ESQ76445.1 hypothetical protein ABAC402_04915 [Asticcacaulis sp. AC402]
MTAIPLGAENAVPLVGAGLVDPASQILGDSASSESLKRLISSTDRIKQIDTLILLKEALVMFKRGNWIQGGELALKALHVDEKSAQAWHVLAIAREKAGDLKTAITCFETALRISPEDAYIANDLGRLAFRLSLNDLAQKFFLHFLASHPNHPEAMNNLASVLREKNDLDGAIEVLQTAIAAHPEDPQLWNAIGTVINARGDTETAGIFYREALKFDPDHCHGNYNYGNVLTSLGQFEDARRYFDHALPRFTDPMNVYTCKLSMAFAYLAEGDLKNGWTWYRARTKENTPEHTVYMVQRPRWDSDMPLEGKRIFVSAEQGLGDEIMFGSLLPDLIREVGPSGHVGIGVEKRLVPLFQKGFPDCTVVHHHTVKHQGHTVRIFPDIKDWGSWDAYALMCDFLPRYRSKIEDFTQHQTFFRPDPERVAYWKAILSGLNDKPKVGVLWKSAISHSRRNRYYSPFDDWKEVLSLDGIQFINLQYGDTEAEMEEARNLGLDIWTPPGIDLKNDLDDLSALCMAMNCILGPANATSNIAAAAGVKIWIASLANTWISLGTGRLPWYADTRLFFADNALDWQPVMQAMRDALIEEFLN